MARLFEGLVFLALGYKGRLEEVDNDSPGKLDNFRVRPNAREVELWVDRHLPEEPGHIWGSPVIRLNAESEVHQLRFVRFFDWDQLAVREFRYLEILIERLDLQPELVGHHGLIEVGRCSIWLVEDDVPSGPEPPIEK